MEECVWHEGYVRRCIINLTTQAAARMFNAACGFNEEKQIND